jgi:hypothetical protein
MTERNLINIVLIAVLAIFITAPTAMAETYVYEPNIGDVYIEGGYRSLYIYMQGEGFNYESAILEITTDHKKNKVMIYEDISEPEDPVRVWDFIKRLSIPVGKMVILDTSKKISRATILRLRPARITQIKVLDLIPAVQ